MRVSEEIEVEVCDEDGEEHWVTVRLDGLWTQPSRFDPGEQPDVILPEVLPPGVNAEEVEAAAWETWLESHYRR